MSLEKYAKEELEKAGLFDKDSDYNGMLGESVMELIKVFAKQGHSGYSANLTVTLFDKLVRFKPITPLTHEPDEWMEVGTGMWQNRRDGEVFSTDGGKTWYNVNEKGRSDDTNLRRQER